MERGKEYDKKRIMKMIFNNKLIFLYLAYLFFIFSSLGFCGFISISITSSTIYFNQSENEATADLIIKNVGNEAAINCKLEIVSKYFSGENLQTMNIQPNEEKRVELKIRKKEDIGTGTYHAGILMRYEDANGYKFSLVSPLTIVNKIERYSNLYGILESVSIVKEGNIKLKVYNLENKDKKINITFLFPEELRVENNIREITIPNNEQKELYFKVNNLKGLKESNYFVFAIIEEIIGEEVEEHASSIAGGYIKIVEKTSDIGSGANSNLIADIPLIFRVSLVSIILLLFLYTYFSLKDRRKEET